MNSENYYKNLVLIYRKYDVKINIVFSMNYRKYDELQKIGIKLLITENTMLIINTMLKLMLKYDVKINYFKIKNFSRENPFFTHHTTLYTLEPSLVVTINID